MLLIFCASLTLGPALFVLWYQGTIHFHMLFVDYPNPEGRGLKGVVVSTPEFVRDMVVVAGLSALVAIAWRAVRRLP